MSCFAYFGQHVHHKPAYQAFSDAHVLDRQPRSDLAEPGGDILNAANDEPLAKTTIPQIEALGVDGNPYPTRPEDGDLQPVKLILIVEESIARLLIRAIEGKNIRIENARDPNAIFRGFIGERHNPTGFQANDGGQFHQLAGRIGERLAELDGEAFRLGIEGHAKSDLPAFFRA